MFFGEVMESMSAIGWKPVCRIGIMQRILGGEGAELVDVARRDNSGTEGESEVEGVFSVTYSDS